MHSTGEPNPRAQRRAAPPTSAPTRPERRGVERRPRQTPRGARTRDASSRGTRAHARRNSRTRRCSVARTRDVASLADETGSEPPRGTRALARRNLRTRRCSMGRQVPRPLGARGVRMPDTRVQRHGRARDRRRRRERRRADRLPVVVVAALVRRPRSAGEPLYSTIHYSTLQYITVHCSTL